jgi:S1-C subfamily serine protease
MKKFLYFFFILLGCIVLNAPAVFGENMRDSVVKIFVTANRIDYYRPWQTEGNTPLTGSGFVISGNRILTNAHVVSDNTFIQVRKESSPKKYTAKVQSIGYDCDLAILSVDDAEFFQGVTPLEFGELPELQDSVTVIGFPRGGDKLSITEGVVSRIEIVPYTESSKKLLAVQIDAAINPGNSGGPVLKSGKVVGVAMQLIANSQNIGYMIPMPIIEHFLKDLQDAHYDGFPLLGVEFCSTENKALREYHRMPESMDGVVVTKVMPWAPAEKNLKSGDVLTHIDGIPIGVDGTFEFRKNERMDLSYLITRNQSGENLSLQILREGKERTLTISLTPFVEMVPEPHTFEKPPYYIYGGLVFTVLSVDLLKVWGEDWWVKAPPDFLNYLIGQGRLNERRKKEIVVLLDVLPDDINIGYHGYRNEVIRNVNGKEFNSFKEFIALVEANKSPVIVFETDQNVPIILSNKNIKEVTKRILERNNIPRSSSDDVALEKSVPAPQKEVMAPEKK